MNVVLKIELNISSFKYDHVKNFCFLYSTPRYIEYVRMYAVTPKSTSGTSNF